MPLVLRERGSGTLDAIEMVLAEQGLKLSSLNVRMHLGSTESIKSFLRYSRCIVEVPELTFKRHFCFVSVQGQEAETSVIFSRFVRQCLQSR